MPEYNLNWLKDKGFFKNSIPLEVKGKKVLVDNENLLAYVEVTSSEEMDDVRRKLLHDFQKVRYIWFFFPDTGKLKVFRRIGEVKWFYYSPRMRNDYLKSRIDKLNRFSPDNMNILFDIRDVVEKFYWQLWEHRILMSRSIKELKEDTNKLLVVQHLIDRLIFFYFLAQLKLVKIDTGKEKPWVLDRKNTREFFKWICEQLSESDLQDFFNKIFFDVLGQVNESGFVSKKFGIGEKNFSIGSPCLNGGLFIEEKIENIDERKIKILKIKDLILEVLNNYNWIIGEESPEEEDVIGDLTPEIIGHIYEKFVVSLEQIGLGKINIKDVQTVREELRYGRKKIGAYYTPEEITNYISMNTIYPYIKDKLKEKFGKNGEVLLDNLFRKNNFSKEDLEIIKYLYFTILTKMKICDNACGSGSFLIAAGDVLLRLYSRTLKILEDNLADYEDVKKVLRDIRESPNRNYYIVRQIIVNNLYGVDIMEGAIEIAKLRFWLWLISQVDPKRVEKRIKTLPNLDFNLMVGNSLIGFIDIEDIDFNKVKIQLEFDFHEDKNRWLKYFAKQKQEFKTLPSHEAVKLKEKLSKELEEAREFLNEKFYDMLKSNGIKISKEEFLELKPFHWGFEFYEVFDLEKPKEERGFDVIIGNPPYGDILSENEKNVLLSLNFRVMVTDDNGKGTRNSAAIFIERSQQLLAKNGKFGYILPKSLLYVEEWEKTRKLLLNDVNLLRVVDCSKAFMDVKLEMCIIIYENQIEKLSSKVVVHNLYIWNLKKYSTDPYPIDRKYLTNERFITEIDSIKKEIIENILSHSVPLGKICNIQRGLSLNKFVSDTYTKNTVEILRGDDIGRYSILKTGYINKKYLINSEFQPGKLLFQRIVAHIENPYPHIKLTGTFNENNYISVNTVTNIILKEEYEKFLKDKFLLLLLNSKLMSWYTYKYIFVNAIRSMDFVGKYASSVPIINPELLFVIKIQEPFIILCDYMLFLNATKERRTKEKELIDFIDKQIIDSLVYELYFKEKFKQDGVKTNLSELVEPYLEDISNLNSDEQKRQTIDRVVEKIKSDEGIMKQIEKIKSHPWVKVVEGEEK